MNIIASAEVLRKVTADTSLRDYKVKSKRMEANLRERMALSLHSSSVRVCRSLSNMRAATLVLDSPDLGGSFDGKSPWHGG